MAGLPISLLLAYAGTSVEYRFGEEPPTDDEEGSSVINREAETF